MQYKQYSRYIAGIRYEYDSKGRKLEQVEQLNTENKWIPWFLFEDTHDENGILGIIKTWWGSLSKLPKGFNFDLISRLQGLAGTIILLCGNCKKMYGCVVGRTTKTRSKTMDNEGFDPSTSRMLSVRSTNWASRPDNRLTRFLLVTIWKLFQST